MNTVRTVLAIALLFAAACRNESAQLRAGEHRFHADMPRGWSALQQGSQLVLRPGASEVHLTFSDFGPARPKGFRDEVGRARELWSGGRDDEARTRLREMRVRPDLFASDEEYERFREAWSPLAAAKRGTTFEEVEAWFDELGTVMGGLQPAPIDAISEGVLSSLDHDSRREIKMQQQLRVDTREAMRVDTWSVLTHTDERRYLLILNDGRLLVLRCERCDATAAKAFDEVSGSLRFGGASPT